LSQTRRRLEEVEIMWTFRAIPPLTLGLLLFTSAALAAGGTVTVRVGEQDSCTVTGVTTVTKDTVRFDLAKLNAKAVTKATLRLWVSLGRRAPYGRAFSVKRWEDPKFDGFKVWRVGGDDKPLDVFYPFTSAFFGCHEWDVTPAVQAWVKDPTGNKGLRTNFPIPPNTFAPAWQRPYLEITYDGDAAGRPKQASAIRAFYRHGQVFITWKQVPYDGAFFDSTYRVYMHTEPITAANLSEATRLGEVHRNSQLNYRRATYAWDGLCAYGPFAFSLPFLKVPPRADGMRRTRGETMAEVHKILPPRYNFVIDDAWPQKVAGGKWLSDGTALGPGLHTLEGPQLSDDTGLFVHTVKKPGKRYFAVTSVIEGWENRADISPANSLAAALEVQVEKPKPVLQFVLVNNGRRKMQYRQYTYWEGGTGDFHHEPSTPFMLQIFTPVPFVWKGARGRTVCQYGGYGAAVVGDTRYVPPTRLAPFPTVRISLNRDYGHWVPGWRYYYGTRKPPRTAKEGAGIFGGKLYLPWSNRYGYHDALNTGGDPRKAVVRPYIESRMLHEIDAFFDVFPQADRNLTLISGQGPAMTFGMHHGDRIASVSSAMDFLWSAKRAQRDWPFVGRQEWNLKVPEGFRAWDWNDALWFSKKFPKKTWAFISTTQSPNYDRADNFRNWQDCGYPDLYLGLVKAKRGGRFWWVDIGDAPDGKGQLVPLNQAYPAFTNVNFCEVPRKEWRKEPRGTVNGYLVWFGPGAVPKKGKTAVPLGLVDEPARFEMAVRIGDRGLRQNGQSVPPTNAKFGKTDITLWRLQQFKVEPGKTYVWTNRKVATGQLLQAGTVKPDDRNLLTVAGFLVDRDPTGNKLIIEPGDSAPRVDTSIRVGGLAYAEYVKQCSDPVMMPTVKLPSTTFKASEFTLARGCNADGSITFTGRGGFGLGGIATTVKIPKAGRYVIALRAKGSYGVSWPVVIMNIGGRYGRVMPPRIITDTEWATYRWYDKLHAGKLHLKISTPNDYYIAGQLADFRKGRYLHIADMTITRVPDGPTAAKPIEIRLAPRGVGVPVGLRTQMSATVLNGLGLPMAVPVTWKAEGAEIDAHGRLLPAKPGTCTVTASAAGLRRSVVLEAVDTFVENFNEASGTLRDGWAAASIENASGKWFTPDRGHHMLNSLWHTRRKPGKSMLLWKPGTPFDDCEIQADVIISPHTRMSPAGTRGLVIRAKDRDNHYRLEVERGANISAARLVKRVKGVDTVIAQTDKAPGYAPFDWRTNPCSTQYPKNARNTDARFEDWRLDRLRLAAKGGVIRAWINGKEVFPGGVRDDALKTGAVGLYAESPACFDNVNVRDAQ